MSRDHGQNSNPAISPCADVKGRKRLERKRERKKRRNGRFSSAYAIHNMNLGRLLLCLQPAPKNEDEKTSMQISDVTCSRFGHPSWMARWLLNRNPSCKRSVIGQLERGDARLGRLRGNNHPTILTVDDIAEAVAQPGKCDIRPNPVHFGENNVAPYPSALSTLHQEKGVERRQDGIC